MHPLLRPKHIALTLIITVLMGTGGFTVLGFASAQDGADGQEPFRIAPFHQGDAGALVLEPGDVDEDDLRRGLPPDRSGRIDFAIGASRPAFDADGVERIATPLQIRTEEDGRVDEKRLLMDGAFGPVIGVEYETVTKDEQNEDSVKRTTWWGTDFNVPAYRLHCAFVPPFEQGRLDDERHQDKRDCDFGPYGLDAGGWYWQAAGIGQADGVRVLEIHLWYDPSLLEQTPDMQVWYREDIPVPIRMQDNTGYGGIKEGDAWVLTSFERGDKPIQTGTTGRMLPQLQTTAPTDVLLDDRGVDVRFSLSEALARARSEHLPLRQFEAEHADAFLFCGRHAAFDMEDHTERWTFWLVERDATFGLAVTQHTRVDDVTAEVSTAYRYDEEPGGCPLGNDALPASPPARVPTVSSLRAQADLLLEDLYNPDGSFGWEFQVDDDGSLHAWAGQTYFYREHNDVDAVLGLVTGEEDRLDAWDTATVRWWDGERIGFGGTEQIHASGRYAEEAGPGPTLADTHIRPVTGAWTVPPTTAIAGVAVGVGIVGLLYWISPLLKAPLAGLFSRVRKDKALEHPVRAGLVAIIGDEPGIHFQDLVRRSGRGRGTVEHHIQVLTDKGLVGTRVGPGYRCFFISGKVDRRIMEAAPVLKAPAAKQILTVLCDEARVTDIADRVGVSKGAVSRHIRRMEQVGLVVRRREGRNQWLKATELGMQACGGVTGGASRRARPGRG